MSVDYNNATALVSCDECGATEKVEGMELAGGYAFQSGIEGSTLKPEGGEKNGDDHLCCDCSKGKNAEAAGEDSDDD